MNIRNPSITIIGGTGAVGAYFAKQFVEAGYTVSIIGRKSSKSLTKCIEQGLTIKSNQGQITIPNTSFAYIGNGVNFPKPFKQHLVIICLKQNDFTLQVASKAVEITYKDASIGIITNGIPVYFLKNTEFKNQPIEALDPQGTILNMLSSRTLIGIHPVIASHTNNEGVVEISRPLEKISVKLGSPDHVDLTLLCTMFIKANIKETSTISYKELQKNILEKLQFALSINTLSALFEKNLGYVFHSEETEDFMKYVILFTNQLAKELHLEPLRGYDQFKKTPITEKHFSSMYQSMKDKKPLELAPIFDAPMNIIKMIQEKNKSHTITLSTEPLDLLKDFLIRKSKTEVITPAEHLKFFKVCKQSILENNKNLRARL